MFVVDLSGSMNDDTEPAWAEATIENEWAPKGYPGIAAELMTDVFDDFGFGTYPGHLEYIGENLPGVPQDRYAYAEMTKDDGSLTDLSIAAQYRIANTDDEATRKLKAYRWIIDNQIAVIMPAAEPAPDSTINYGYWEKYIDYVISRVSVGENPPPPPDDGDDEESGGSEPPPDDPPPPPPPPPPPKPPIGLLQQPEWWMPRRNQAELLIASTSSSAVAEALLVHAALGQSTMVGVPRRGSTLRISLPHYRDGDNIDDFNNPNKYTFPGASSSLPRSYRDRIGYMTYVQFMMDWGRDRSPDWSNSSNSAPGNGTKTPLSTLSAYCPFHMEATAGGTFSFPPREQPMHAARRALIAAIQVVKEQNALLPAAVGDQVAVVTFDGLDSYHSAQVVQPLTGDYDAAMQSCTTLQATSDIGATTGIEPGLQLARDHLEPLDQGGQGRGFATKVVVLLTDGVPNVWITPQADIDEFVAENPSSEYYDSAYVWYNSALYQAAQFGYQKDNLYNVGIGLGTDYDFMDRMARLAGTDEGGQARRGSGNPAQYEQVLTAIFTEIIKNPGGRLVD